jgi:hypothetical protein
MVFARARSLVPVVGSLLVAVGCAVDTERPPVGELGVNPPGTSAMGGGGGGGAPATPPANGTNANANNGTNADGGTNTTGGNINGAAADAGSTNNGANTTGGNINGAATDAGNTNSGTANPGNINGATSPGTADSDRVPPGASLPPVGGPPNTGRNTGTNPPQTTIIIAQ